MERKQKLLTLAKIILAVVFVLGLLAVVYLWWLFATAKCEGFGCIGLGWLIFLLISIGSANAVIGVILQWLDRKCTFRKPPAWFWALQMLNLSPLLWLVFRMLTTK